MTATDAGRGSVASMPDIRVGLLLVAAAALAHAPALVAAFQFDDYAVIVDNRAVHSLAAWWASMPGIRPLLKLSYALNHAAWPSSLGFHGVNLALHAINTVLLWRLLHRGLPRLGAPATGAAIGALLFALHPATTEAVTYASGRSISLAATFMLGAWLADAHAAARGVRVSLASPMLFALALGVRETSVVVPFAILLFAACTPNPDWRAIAARLGGHAVVLAVALMAFLALPGYQRFFATSLATREFGAQFVLQLHAHAYLIAHPLVSLRTNIDPLVGVGEASAPMTALIAFGCGAILAAALVLRRRWPWFAFGIFWYLLLLAPANSLLPRLDAANDRHLYLALAGPAWIVAIAILRMPAPRLRCAILLLLAGVLGGTTVHRAFDYRNEVALWRASIAAEPANARAWINLGYALRREGDLARARDAYACALAFEPRSEQAVLNLDAIAVAGDASPVPRAPLACTADAFAPP